jgi:hypothetical protein
VCITFLITNKRRVGRLRSGDAVEFWAAEASFEPRWNLDRLTESEIATQGSLTRSRAYSSHFKSFADESARSRASILPSRKAAFTNCSFEALLSAA